MRILTAMRLRWIATSAVGIGGIAIASIAAAGVASGPIGSALGKSAPAETASNAASGSSERIQSPDDVSPEQMSMLSDGVATFEEYEAAILAAVQCMTDQGLSLREAPYVDASGHQIRFSIWASGDPDEDARIVRVRTDCLEEHAMLVSMAYARSIRPSDATIADARAALVACLLDAGFPGADNLNELVENRGHDIEAFAGCSAQVSQEFGIPNFAG